MSGLASARRVVVKIGSALVVGPDGAPDSAWLSDFAADLARLRARGQQVLVVSSGAVALGRRRLGLNRKALTLPEKQAAAAARVLAGHGAEVDVVDGDTLDCRFEAARGDCAELVEALVRGGIRVDAAGFHPPWTAQLLRSE